METGEGEGGGGWSDEAKGKRKEGGNGFEREMGETYAEARVSLLWYERGCSEGELTEKEMEENEGRVYREKIVMLGVCI
ncbi:hypothetical protein PV325_003771 [Microctonus aethiopoides]|nr:hypothetical protein PV325_003771 [Microctonus aethiopoides]KAK0093333.1 hypothetical protein PV326_013787 [Microctonus aethiopoides]